MGIFDKIWRNKEVKEYLAILSEITNPLMDRIDAIEDKKISNYFQIILDASERSLRAILFTSPEEFNFKKQVSKEDIRFWIHKVSLAFISYSAHFFDNKPLEGVDETLKAHINGLANLGENLFFSEILEHYNKIFNEEIWWKEVYHYSSGLKEDCEKGYSESGKFKKTMEMAQRDYKTIASELLQKIWKEDINSNEKKCVFLGDRIWKAYQQLIQPFLVSFLEN